MGSIYIDGMTMGKDNPLPTKRAKRVTSIIQTHNAVSLNPNASSPGTSWVNLDGYDKVSCICKGDTTHQMSMSIVWSMDGSTFLCEEAITSAANASGQVTVIDVKAPYAKLKIFNKDTSTPHTMSAWMYLQA